MFLTTHNILQKSLVMQTHYSRREVQYRRQCLHLEQDNTLKAWVRARTFLLSL
jgi:hypothetical protein